MERKTGLASVALWLSWWITDWSSWLRDPLILFKGNWFLRRSLFPRKEEFDNWLSHMSRVRKTLTKSINYKERNYYQTTTVYKKKYSKSCRAAEEFWRFSIELRAERGCCGCYGAGGVIISDKSSSSTIVMVFSADPASSLGKRKSLTR